MPARSAPTNRAWKRWAALLGFALGGFFDGILFHQILQWHHLLSLVEGAGDLRAQVVWDGYFHVLMYLIAGVALWGLWRGREGLSEGWGRELAGALLLGFGLWQVVDVVVFHWIAGIHRLRLDSPNPLAWDTGWLVALGLVPLAAGWLLLRRGPGGAAGPRGSTVAVLLAGLVTAGMGAWAMQPAPGQRFTTVVFAPGMTQAQAMEAVIAADARLVWSDPAMAVVVVDVSSGKRMRFYRHGAMLVSGSGDVAGCLGWSKA